MTPDEFKQCVLNEVDELIGLAKFARDRIVNGEDVLACLRSIECIAHNAEISAMMLARKAPRG